MSNTPEGKVKHEVKKILIQHKAYYFMPVQAGYGKQGLDFHCTHYGFSFYIETKAAGKKLTGIQKMTKLSMEAAGAKVFVIDGTDKTDTYEDLVAWLESVDTVFSLVEITAEEYSAEEKEEE